MLYVDLDAYYVACEVRDRPELEGRPVLIGPDPSKGPTRGVVLSASYPARAQGARSAMPAQRAAALVPDAIWIPPDFGKYERISHDVVELLRRFSDRVVPLSIDEAAVEIEAESADAAGEVARRVQAAVRSELRLSASVGVATHRTVAKIASDLRKPGGLVVVPPEAIAAVLAPLPVRAVPGIGPKTEARLAKLGIVQVGELPTASRTALRREFGRFADELVELALGRPPPLPAGESGPQLRSTDHTFAHDVTELEPLRAELAGMARGLFEALRRERLRGESVGVALRWEDFQRSQRSRTLAHTLEGPEEIEAQAERLLRGLWEAERRGRGRAVRTLSLRIERLRPVSGRLPPLDGWEPGAPGAA